MVAEDGELAETRAAAGDGLDKEARERIELRSKASLGTFFRAALTGKTVTGAEAELQAAAAVDGIPIEMWEPDPRIEARRADPEHRAITPAPGTAGINLDPIRPFTYSRLRSRTSS